MSTFRSGSRLSYGSTSDVTKFLTSQRPFAQSFDLYLTQVCPNYHNSIPVRIMNHMHQQNLHTRPDEASI